MSMEFSVLLRKGVRSRPDWSVELATLDVTTEEERSWVVDCTPTTVAQEQSNPA